MGGGGGCVDDTQSPQGVIPHMQCGSGVAVVTAKMEQIENMNAPHCCSVNFFYHPRVVTQFHATTVCRCCTMQSQKASGLRIFYVPNFSRHHFCFRTTTWTPSFHKAARFAPFRPSQYEMLMWHQQKLLNVCDRWMKILCILNKTAEAFSLFAGSGSVC